MVGFLLLALLAGDTPGEWKQIVTGDVNIFTRLQPGARVHEIRGTMTMKVTPAEIRAVVTDESYARRAPYMAEYRTLAHPTPTTWVRYTRLGLPIIEDRDYFIEVTREQDLAPDGSGSFRSTWKPWGLDRPERKGVVRVTVNSGYWSIQPAAGGTASEVEYYLMFDPGGSIPAWVAEQGNKRILPDVMRGLEKECLRRRAEGKTAPAP